VVSKADLEFGTKYHKPQDLIYNNKVKEKYINKEGKKEGKKGTKVGMGRRTERHRA